MGGAAPAITGMYTLLPKRFQLTWTEDGTGFKVNGGSYNSRSDAVYASCMLQMNACKNWANSLPNAQVGVSPLLLEHDCANDVGRLQLL